MLACDLRDRALLLDEVRRIENNNVAA